MIFIGSRKVSDELEIDLNMSPDKLHNLAIKMHEFCPQCNYEIGCFNQVCRYCYDFYNFVKKEDLRMNVIEECMTDYMTNSDVIMSEYLRSCPYELNVSEKRYLLIHADEYMYCYVMDNGEIVNRKGNDI